MKKIMNKNISSKEAKKTWEEMRKQARGNEDMTLEEINEEIRLTRQENKKRQVPR